MYQNVCKSCGSIDLFTKEKGNQVGLYCSDCGKWIKWLSKDELNAFNYAEGKEEVMNEIRQIISEYFNGTDLLGGSDECYVISRIAGLVGYDYGVKDTEQSEETKEKDC